MKIFSKKYYDAGDGTSPFPNPRRPKNIIFHEGDGTSARFCSIRKKRKK